MRIGVFGGTFDPPHIGHVLLAGDACEALQLQSVVWVPVAQQPLKGSPPLAGAPHRRRMVELAIAEDTRFTLDAVEIDRGGLSFTIDTLRTISERNRGVRLVLLVGADAWATFEEWRDPKAILTLAAVAVLARDGEGAPPRAGYTPEVVTARRVDVSSTEIRDRVRRRLPINGFVSDAVAKYIRDESLYA